MTIRRRTRPLVEAMGAGPALLGLAGLGYDVARLPSRAPLAESLGDEPPELLALSSFDFVDTCGRRAAYAQELFAGALGYRTVFDGQPPPRPSEWLGSPAEAGKANPPPS
jgi:hypothetical protein